MLVWGRLGIVGGWKGEEERAYAELGTHDDGFDGGD